MFRTNTFIHNKKMLAYLLDGSADKEKSGNDKKAWFLAESGKKKVIL
jgi:hypothetical protein